MMKSRKSSGLVSCEGKIALVSDNLEFKAVLVIQETTTRKGNLKLH